MTTDDTPPEQDDPAGESTGWIRHEWDSSKLPSTAVIDAVAAATNCDPTAMSRLYDYADPDALDSLMAPQNAGTTHPVTVSFIETQGGYPEA